MEKIKYDYTVDMDSNTSAAKILRLIKPGKKILEFGPSTGYMTKILKGKYNCNITCMEINEKAAEKAMPYCDKMIVGDLETIIFEDKFNEKYDFILFADVLEHLKYPSSIVYKCRDLLTPDGSILASIPNIAHIGVILDLMEGNFKYRPLGLLDETHLRFFSQTNVYKLFEENGFYISNFDRTICGALDSEFRKDLSCYNSDVIKEIYKLNPNADTYQFIVKAQLENEHNSITRLRTNILKLELDIDSFKTQIIQKDLIIEKQINELELIFKGYRWKLGNYILSPFARIRKLLKRLFLANFTKDD